MIDLSKVVHKRLRDHVPQWIIRNIWEKNERRGGAVEKDLITSIRLEFVEVYALKLCDRHHLLSHVLTRALINLPFKNIRKNKWHRGLVVSSVCPRVS